MFALQANSQIKEFKKLRYKDKDFQLSFFPGLSSNGLGSGHYFNKFSINLFGGISAGNHYFELGGISNLNTNSAGGIQLAGMANIIGSNTFLNMTLREERQVLKDGFSSDFKGVQFSGLINFVRNEVQGIQVTGGFNVNNGNAWALQFAGIGNSVAYVHSGLQVAGLFNTAFRGAGTQISMLYNVTRGESRGLQLAMVNQSKRIKGKLSSPPTRARGGQIGLINIAKKMEGTQIGLVNFGGTARGTQIGLINFFSKAPPEVHGKGNTPIGLLNFGAGGHFRVYGNELFLTAIEYTTGNCANCAKIPSGMPLSGLFKKENQNALILAYNPSSFYRNDVKWAFGYGFERVMYNKHSTVRNVKNEKRFINIGVRWLHLNRSNELFKELSLLNKIHAEYGQRVRGLYLFAGFSMNLYLFENEGLDNTFQLAKGNINEYNYQLWPGFTFGVQL